MVKVYRLSSTTLGFYCGCEKTEKNYKKSCQDSFSLGQDLNLRPSEQKSGVLNHLHVTFGLQQRSLILNTAAAKLPALLQQVHLACTSGLLYFLEYKMHLF
jgi:hypothetical protein